MATRDGTSIDSQMNTPQYAWRIKLSFIDIDYLDQDIDLHLYS